MTRDGIETEAAIIGYEGMVDVAAILGARDTILRSFIQIPGQGLRLPAQDLITAYHASESLRAMLNRFASSLLFQIAQTALANASFSIEQRLARWLVMCADRTGPTEMALTHELLAMMLNVRRAGVTQALQSLKIAGFLEYRRGAIWVTDRDGLRQFAIDAYTPLPTP
jgi:CRP-like cAMP-binding protein